MRARTFLGIVIIAFLVFVVVLLLFEIYRGVTTTNASLVPAATTTVSPAAVTSPSPVASPPTTGQIITQAEKNVLDPISAALSFASAVLISILVIFLFLRIWYLTGMSNLVIDAFNNATGKDDLDKILPGLNELTRERLAQVLEEVRSRINSNPKPDEKDSTKHNQEGFRLSKFPVPRQASDDQLSNLLKSLKDVSTGNVNAVVQLMSLVFTPRGTKVTATLQSKADTPAILGISLEVLDLEGRQEAALRTIEEESYAPDGSNYSQPAVGLPPLPTLASSPQVYYDLGVRLQKLGLYEDAIHYFEETLKQDRTFNQAAQALAECTSCWQVQRSGATAYAIGKQLQGAGLLQEAVESYKKPLPPDSQDAAEKAWKTVLKLASNGQSDAEPEARAYLTLAKLYGRDKVYLFDQSLELYKAAAARGSRDAAKELEAIQQAGADELTGAGQILYGLVQYDAAEKYLTAALAKVPGGPGAQAILAKVKQGRPPEEHKDALPSYTLGRLYEQRGAFDEAKVQYETALTKQPDFEAAKDALERVLHNRKTLEDRYLDLVEPAARWLAIELARRSLEEGEQNTGQRIKRLFDRIWHSLKREQCTNYQAQLYNFIGSFHQASAFTYKEFPFFYDVAIKHFKQANTFDERWFQPYQNLADTSVMQLIEWLLGKRSILPAFLALSLQGDQGQENRSWDVATVSYLVPSTGPKPWPSEPPPWLSAGHGGRKINEQIRSAIDYLYEALTNYRKANEYYEEFGDRLCQSDLPARNNAEDHIKRRISLGKCTAQLLTGDKKLIDDAVDLISKMKVGEGEKDCIFLYNLACWYGIAHKLNTFGNKYEIPEWKMLPDNVDAQQTARRYLGYSLARNQARDLWNLPLDDPCFYSAPLFDGIFKPGEYERLIRTLSLKMHDVSGLSDLKVHKFKEEVNEVFHKASWID